MNKADYKTVKALESLDDIQQAAPMPFLLTRINAAMLNRNIDDSIWSRIAMVIKKPAVAFCALLMLLIVNIIVIKKNDPFSKNIAGSAAPAKYDFAINVSAVYDTENMEP
jgi:hypothetical protein